MVRAACVRLAFVAALVSALSGADPACAAEAFIDDAGHRVEIGAPARRIVTLAPHLAELAFAAGAGAQVVGVSSYTDWPDAARALPQVAISGQVDLERLVMARPDLVLTWTSGVPAQENTRIERLGFRVVSVEIRRLEDVAVWLRRIGALAGTAPAAQTAASAYERELAALITRHRGRPPVSTFYEIWNDPLMTLSGTHLVSQILSVCGGRNVYADATTLAPVVSLEDLIATRPAAVLVAAPPEQAAKWTGAWRTDPRLKAVGARHVESIDPALANRMGPRVLDGVKAVCGALERAR
jgi:iron complex transport system substrate-binding protein